MKEISVLIGRDSDIVIARKRGMEFARQLGFSPGESTMIGTAISEVARNIFKYAGRGRVTMMELRERERIGVMIVAIDKGPGIVDIGKAMQNGYSSADGLGLGLPGSKRLMDEFELVSHVGIGTTVMMKKWKKS